MKKILSTIMAVCLVLGCVFTLSACSSTLSGTYKADVFGVGASYEFTITGKVTITAYGLGQENELFEGKYEINKDGDKITFTFESDDAEKYSGEFSFNKGKDNDGEYIKIGGITYRKAK